MSATMNDGLALREAFGHFATGVAVVTARNAEGQPVGMTVNSFSSVSLDPPLVLFSIDKRARGLDSYRTATGLAVNVLGRDQQALSVRFAGTNPDKWSGVAHRPGTDGAPLLADTLAHFECAPWAIYEGGDHLIFVCRVAHYAFDAAKAPLLFFNGRYHDLERGGAAKAGSCVA